MRNSLTTPLALRRTGSTPGVVAARAGSTPSAFTLIEILVALAILMLMMAIILVPINMGLSVFHIGKARSEVQQANQLVLNQLASELKRAVFVFPNEEMPGITNKAPYTANGNKPYYDPTITPAADRPVSNTARLDFLLPALSGNGSILTPPHANNYIVTYYARRLDPDPTRAYDVFTNPIVLWRAQYPYRVDPTGTPYGTAPDNLANLDSSRYPVTASPRNQWLSQSYGEPTLKPTTSTDYFYDHPIGFAASTSNTQITPRDMALVSPISANPGLTRAELPEPAVDYNGNTIIDENEKRSYQPDSSFICDDTNNDGKIDRVTMSLLLQKYDSLGAADDKSQQIRSTQSVALPNIK
jgi:type II secretory pathway pseudopilin PulG